MIAGLILAGGRATRLGGIDKATITLNGQSLLIHVHARLTPQVAAIAISGPETLPDSAEFVGTGPLAGIEAGLTWADAIGATALLSVPVDTPLIPENLAAKLSPAPAVAVYGGRQHHLVALWPTSFLPRLRTFLRTDPKHRVRDALELCMARPINFTGPADPFYNINTPEDLAYAESLLHA